MFARLATLVPIAALVAVATAAPNALEVRGDDTDCSTSGNYCCNTTQDNFSTAGGFTGLLGGVISSDGVLGSFNCDPLSIIGIGSSGTCTQQTACCTDNDVNGVVNIVCSPININL